jgi:tRNA-Thr(GGU) m(6)t(6)A37 methyltransferase TsaA
MLAPNSRGIITFHEHKVSKDSILELQHFSHVFVVFVFHLNSNTNVRQNTFDDKKNRGQRQFPSKIAPPSLGGKKVGVFSTRTPHRPNPIGFSLCKLDKVMVDSGNNGGSTFSLLLSGLDIVDGTPILDIKPYVPHYDCVGYDPLRLDGGSTQGNNDLAASTLTNSNNNGVEKESNPSNNASEGVRVPYWVDSGLQKRRKVTFLPEANRFLDNLMTPSSSSQSLLDSLQFYGPKCQWKDSPSDAVEHLRNCMHELLGVDVRSAWQTKKARKGKFQAERSSRVKDWKESNATVGIDANGDSAFNFCSQQIDNLLLKYTIEEPGSALMGTLDERSKGSGAEDIVVVHSISIINSNAR